MPCTTNPRRIATVFLRTALIGALFSVVHGAFAQQPAAHKPVLFDPYPFEEIFTGSLEPASALGATGVTAAFNSNTRSATAPAIVVSGAFPFARETKSPRGSGWSFGAAAGNHNFNQEASSTYTAGAYFWEIMVGRTIVKEDDIPDSGARGYLEVAFRNQRARLNAGYDAFLDEHNRTADERNTALILRAGSSLDPDGQGFVEQKIGKVTPAIDVSLHLPIVSQHATLLMMQLRMPFQCFTTWIRCEPFFRLTNSRNPTGGIDIVDVESKILFGSQFLFLIRPKYLISLQLHWTGYFGPTKAAFGPTQKAVIATPFVRTAFTIAF